jgi:hypothetical protein
MAGPISVLVLLLALFLSLIAPRVSSEPYVYDEADSMYAASRGFAANWSDARTMPLAVFVRQGVKRGQRQALSESIRESGDILFYRHFHGPLFHYLLIPGLRLGWREHAVRAAMLAIPVSTLAVVYFGCWWLLSWTAAVVCAALFLSSYTVLWSTELAPHQLFALCSLASVILLSKAVATSDRRYWYGSVLAAALAFCTLEIALVLLLALVVCGFVERRRWQAGAGFAAKSLALFVVAVLVAWPAAIVRLSFLKAYAVIAYLSLSREAPWGDVSLLETWRSRVLASPLEWGLILLAAMVLSRAPNRSLNPLALCGGLMLLATLRVLTVTPRYSLAFMPILDVLAGLTLVPYLGTLRRPAGIAVVTFAVAGLYGHAWRQAHYQASHQSRNPNPRSAAMVEFIHQNGLENKALLAPQSDIPTLHYYFPGMRLRGYLGERPQAWKHAAFAPDAILGGDGWSTVASKP